MSFICACMIVGIHCTPTPSLGSWQWWTVSIFGADGLCRIAVPWFFFASGFFLAGHFGEEGWYTREVLKRVKTLLVPFVLWAIIGLGIGTCMWYGIQKLGYTCGVRSPFESGVISAFQKALGFDLSRINIGPIWFLRMLFMLVLVSPIICRLIGCLGFVLPVVVLLGYGVYDTIWHFSDFWEYLISLRGVAYFVLGATVRCCRITTGRGFLDALCHACAVGPILLVAHGCALRYGIYHLANVLDFLMVLPIMLLVWKFLSCLKLPRFCIENSFALYVMHSSFLLVSIAIIAKFGLRAEMDSSIALALSRWVFACGCAIMASRCIKWICPLMADLLFGGR